MDKKSILGMAIGTTIEAINLKDNLNEQDSIVGNGNDRSIINRGATTIPEDMKKYHSLKRLLYNFFISTLRTMWFSNG